MITNRCTRGLTENPEAKQIRQTVFVEEQGFHNEFDAMDAEAWHVVLWKDEHAIATGRTFPAQGETHAWTIGRVAVRKPYRGQGIARWLYGNWKRLRGNMARFHLCYPPRCVHADFMKPLVTTP